MESYNLKIQKQWKMLTNNFKQHITRITIINKSGKVKNGKIRHFTIRRSKTIFYYILIVKIS